MTKSTQPWEWSRLQGKITPAVFNAPRLDPHTVGKHCVRYFHNNILLFPWQDQLALITMVLSDHAQLEPGTVMKCIWYLHQGMRALFADTSLQSMDDWNPAEQVHRYVIDDSITVSKQQRQGFLDAYKSTTEHVARYVHMLSEDEYQALQPFVLPSLPPGMYRRLTHAHDIQAEQRQRRKKESDAIVPHFIAIRSEAHLRWNAVRRFYQHYQEAVQDIESGKEALPLMYTYTDPRFGSMCFTLWSRVAFVQARANQYIRESFCRTARLPQEKGSAYFLEFHPSATSDTFLWLTRDANETRGTGTTKGKLFPIPLTKKEKMADFLAHAHLHTNGIVCDPDALYAAATFGLLAVEFITTTGARINEVLQLSLTRECLQTLRVDGEQRLILKLLPKGAEREATYFVGMEMKYTLDKVIAMHKAITREVQLPQVPFNPMLLRSHRFPARPYLLQYWHTHLDEKQLTACIRFLCAGFTFATVDGEEVVLTAHLLRHAFANYVVQTEHQSLDFLAQLLHHRDLAITAYYSEPTSQQMYEQADRVLTSFADDLGDLNRIARRAPAELRRQLDHAQAHVGTLSRVVGGDCTFHHVCPVSLACVGCLWKVPDPARRDEIVEARTMAVTRLQHAQTTNLRLEITKQQRVIHLCDQELDEMQRVQVYRDDEHNPISVQPENEGREDERH